MTKKLLALLSAMVLGILIFTTGCSYKDDAENTALPQDGETQKTEVDYGIKVRSNPAPDKESRALNACGDNLTWTINDDTLIISGTGDMWDFENDDEPWLDTHTYPDKVIFMDGVTGIGKFKLRTYSYSSDEFDVYIPKSVTYINPEFFKTFKTPTIESEAYTIVDDIIFSADMKELVYYPYEKAGLSYTVPESVKKIGDYAFYNPSQNASGTTYSTKLLELNLPSKLEYIGNHAFHSLCFLEELKLPDTLIGIGDYAFYDCERLEEINIPENVTYIGDCAFVACSEIESLYIPASVEKIGYWGTYSNGRDFCPSQFGKGGSWDIADFSYQLSKIEVAKNNKKYCSVDGVLFNKNKTEIIYYPQNKEGTTYTIPNSVKKIGNYAFGASPFSEITIPDSVTEIGDEAFCSSSIKNIKLSNNLKSIGARAFYDTYLDGIEFPDSLTTIGEKAFDCIIKKTVFIPKNLVNFELSSFIYDDYLSYDLASLTFDDEHPLYRSENGVIFNPDKTELIAYSTNQTDYELYYEIPYGVTKIADSAFNYCGDRYISITMPSTVTHIGDRAFSWGRKILSDLSNVKHIGEYAFSSAEFSNRHISLDSVEHIGKLAFYSTNIETVSINYETANYIDEEAFEGCQSLRTEVITTGSNEETTETALPDTQIDISNIKFKEFTKTDDYGIVYSADGTRLIKCPYDLEITNYVVPEGVLEISSNAFSSSSIQNIVLPQSLEYIGNNAFAWSNLTSITIPENVKITGDSAFTYCSNLKNAVIQADIEYMSDFLFYYCENLESVIIDEGLKYLGDYAFSGAKATNIVLPESLEYLGQQAFAYETQKINLPKNLKTIETMAFLNVKKITISDENKYFSTDEYGVIFNKDKTVLEYYPDNDINSYVIPDSVTHIKTYAFDLYKPKNLTIPKSVTRIDSQGWYNEDINVIYLGSAEDWKKIYIDTYSSFNLIVTE